MLPEIVAGPDLMERETARPEDALGLVIE